MQVALARHDAILHASIKDNGGQVFKLIGDAFEAAFTLPANAVKAALAAQRALAAETWDPETGPIKVRMGVHTGPAEVHGTEYSGHTLNRVARIMAAGHGGQILLSLAAAELSRGGLPKDVLLKDLGEHPLKGLSQPEHLYQVLVPDLPQDFPPLVTKHVPRGYQLRELIGEGGFGEVYRAFHPDVGREVAVKIIRPELADQPEFIRRFEAEAQIVARLEHPRIVPLYDYWREPGGAFLVMRLLRGGSLHDLLANGPLSLEQAGEMLAQMAEALSAAHAQGIVHRDLKPANILLDEAGNYYLSDFGIAKDVALEGRQTGTLAMIGSPLYMSPEQMLGEAVTPQSDIYSLGEVLYESLAGECPFGDESLARLIDRQLHEPVPRVSQRRPELPEGIDEVIHQATAKDPNERFPDVLAFAAAFRAALSGEPFPARVIQTVPPAGELANPYKGLRAFQEADTDDFFGREALVERLLARLSPSGDAYSTNGKGSESGRFLAVVGPSGSGKSSVVRAGLLPDLRKGALPGSEQWFVVEMIPGPHPLEELEAALLRVAVNPPESLLNQLKEDHRGLLRAVKRILPTDEGVELLLVIDQFEELFTLVENPSEIQHFLYSLCTAVSEPRSRLRAVITLRADFYDRPLMYPDFSELMRLHTELVLPLSPEELGQAIAMPAGRAGAQFEEGLVSTIAAEVHEQPGALPLLQYSLTELFERKRGRLLTQAVYQEIGGVTGALGRRAEEIYQEMMDEGGQKAARQIFLRLVTLGEGVEDTRRRALRSELEALVGFSQDLEEYEQEGIRDRGKGPVEKVLDAYGRARLLSFDRDPITRGPTVEIAHEALLREWRRLREWLDDSREGLRLQRRMGSLAGEWVQANKESSFLLRGSRLDQFESWAAITDLALTTDEREFLQASLEERRTRQAEEKARLAREAGLERRSRNFLRALVLVMALATAFSLFLSWFAFRQRDSARQNAALATSRELVRFAEAELEAPTDPSFSLELLLARQAVLTTWQIDRTVLGEAERALRNAINAAPILDKELSAQELPVRFAAWSPDGKQVLSADAGGTARLWDVESGNQILEFSGHKGEINTVAWSPDGAQIMTAGQDKTIRLWDAKSGEELDVLTGEASIASALWSPDGAFILVVAGKNVKILESLTGKTQNEAQNSTGTFNYADWSPAGDRFATADDIDSIKVWDSTMQGVPVSFEENNGPVNSVQWSHDGRYLLSAHLKNLARIWDVQEGKILRDLNHQASVQFAAWSPDDNQVATVTADGNITIWNAATGELIWQWRAHDQILWSVAWSPDGSQILTADGDSVARIWEASSLEKRNSLRHRGPVLSVSWSPDGTKLLTAGGLTLSANIWGLKDNSLLKSLPNPGSVEAVAWSNDGSKVATASLNTVYLWDAITGEKLGSLSGHTGAIETVAWSPTGDFLVTGGQDRTAQIWEAGSGELKHILKGHSEAVLSASWSDDGSRIVTASGDGTARVWDAQAGQELLPMVGHRERINAAVFSPDGESILTASSDQTARVWEANTGKLLYELEGHRGAVWSATWSPNGSLVATAGDDGFVILWDPKTGEQKGEAVQHKGAIWSVAWSPDGFQLASAGHDGVVRLSTVGIEGLLQLAEDLIHRDPPEFTAEESCLYLHDCEE